MHSVKVIPGAGLAWEDLSLRADCSKGGLIEWLVLAPDAEQCRALAVASAKRFTRRQEGQVEAEVATVSRAVQRRSHMRKVKASARRKQ